MTSGENSSRPVVNVGFLSLGSLPTRWTPCPPRVHSWEINLDGCIRCHFTFPFPPPPQISQLLFFLPTQTTNTTTTATHDAACKVNVSLSAPFPDDTPQRDNDDDDDDDEPRGVEVMSETGTRRGSETGVRRVRAYAWGAAVGFRAETRKGGRACAYDGDDDSNSDSTGAGAGAGE